MEFATAFARIFALIPAETVRVRVEGGHFQLAQGPTAASVATWRVCASFFAQAVRRYRHVELEILINDIGLPSELRSRSRRAFALPPIYEEALVQYRIPRSLVKFRFEKSVKNRAASFTKKLLFHEMAPKSGDGRRGYESYELGAKIPLTSPSGVPQCSLLMGQMFSDIGHDYDITINFYSTQIRPTMERASVVAQEFFKTKCRIINCYITTEGSSAQGIYLH